MLHVRSSGQLLHDRGELLILRDKWNTIAGQSMIRFASFEFPEDDAPLSFQMNQKQKDNIECAWGKVINKQPKTFDSCDEPNRLSGQSIGARSREEKEKEKEIAKEDLTQVKCLFNEAASDACPTLLTKDPLYVSRR